MRLALAPYYATKIRRVMQAWNKEKMFLARRRTTSRSLRAVRLGALFEPINPTLYTARVCNGYSVGCAPLAHHDEAIPLLLIADHGLGVRHSQNFGRLLW
jgi:hypothetical protein